MSSWKDELYFKEKYIKYKKKYRNLVKNKKQLGGGYVLNSSSAISTFKNIDLFDTLNEDFAGGLLNNTLEQHEINKHLLTALYTLRNLVIHHKTDLNSRLETKVDKIDKVDKVDTPPV